MKVVVNPDFNQMSEQDRNRTISIDKKFLLKGDNGRVHVLKKLCDVYIKKKAQPGQAASTRNLHPVHEACTKDEQTVKEVVETLEKEASFSFYNFDSNDLNYNNTN